MKLSTLLTTTLIALIVGVFWRGNAAASDAPNATDVRALYDDASATFVDVRTSEEWDAGHLDEAVLLTLQQIDAQTAAAALPDKDAKIVLYCRSGRRAAAAQKALSALGYTDVTAMSGGFSDLSAAGYPVSSDTEKCC